MTSQPWRLNRRTFLRGAGVALALPFMNAMEASTSIARTANTLIANPGQAGKLPKRVAFLTFPNGVSLPKEDNWQFEDWNWYPKGSGKNFEFRTGQAALNPFRDVLSVVQGLSNPAARKIPSHIGSSGFLTCKAVDKSTSRNSMSIDQAIAGALGRQTQLPYMNLSTVGGVGSLHRTYTMSFDKDGKPVPGLSNLKRIYARMYMANSPEAKARLARKERLLNTVYQDAKDLKKNLGTEDQHTLEEYLSSITDLEKRVENDKFWAQKMSAVDKPDLDLELNYTDVENYIQTMYELIYLAFKGDISRVATYQLASEGGDSPVGQMSKIVGIKKDLHGLSHGAANRNTGYQDWGMWDQFVSKQFAFFLKRLQETPEGDGTLLDNTLIMHGSATGRSHDPHNYPIVLAGGQNMGHKSGQWVQYEEQENALSNLYVRMAQAMDVPMERFADSTGIRHDELFA